MRMCVLVCVFVYKCERVFVNVFQCMCVCFCMRDYVCMCLCLHLRMIDAIKYNIMNAV